MRTTVVLTASLCLLLAGCDLAGSGENASKAGPQDAGTEMDGATKFQDYARLMSDDMSFAGFDPVEDLNRYERLDIPMAKDDVEVSLFPRTIELAVSDLKRARAGPGVLPDLDAAVDRAIPALERLLARARGLDSYYTTRGYLIDDFARGRNEHPLLLADYRAVIASWQPLNAAYAKARDEKLAKDAEFYRREGRSAEYYDVLIVQKAATLTRTIDTPEAARDPARTAAADRTVDELLSLIQSGRRARTTLDPDAAAISDKGVPENIEQMIGAWRELQRKPDADHHEAMMQPFGAAMQAMTLS